MKNSEAYRVMIEDRQCVMDKDGDITKWEKSTGLLIWDVTVKAWMTAGYQLLSNCEPYEIAYDPLEDAFDSMDDLRHRKVAIFSSDRVYKVLGCWYFDTKGCTPLTSRYDHDDLFNINNWRKCK